MSRRRFEPLGARLFLLLAVPVAGCNDPSSPPGFRFVPPARNETPTVDVFCAHDQRLIVCTAHPQIKAGASQTEEESSQTPEEPSLVVVDTESRASTARRLQWQPLRPIVVGGAGALTPLVLSCTGSADECKHMREASASKDPSEKRCERDRGTGGEGGAGGDVSAGGEGGSAGMAAGGSAGDAGGNERSGVATLGAEAECSPAPGAEGITDGQIYAAFAANGAPCCLSGASPRVSFETDRALQRSGLGSSYMCEADAQQKLELSTLDSCGADTPVKVRYRGNVLTFRHEGAMNQSVVIDDLIEARVDAVGAYAFGYSARRLVVYRAADASLHELALPAELGDAQRHIESVDLGCSQATACTPSLLFVTLDHKEGYERPHYAVVPLEASAMALFWGGATSSAVKNWDVSGKTLVVSFDKRAHDGLFPVHLNEFDAQVEQPAPIVTGSHDAIEQVGVFGAHRGYLLHDSRDGSVTALDWGTTPVKTTSISGFLLQLRIERIEGSGGAAGGPMEEDE